MENMRKSLIQVIVCLRKTQRSLSCNFSSRTPGRILSRKAGKITRTPAESVDISSVVHRSLRDQFVSLNVTEERVQF